MRGWLRNARTRKGLSMLELAKMLHISESYYSMIESGNRQKRMDIVFASALSVALNIPIETILDLERHEMAN